MSENTNGKRVAELADAMTAQGIAVSASLIRQAMDGREPYSKVFSALNEWRGRKSGGARLPDVPMLENIEHTLKSVMEIIWRAGVIQARDGIKELREAVTARLNVLDGQLSDAVGEIARLESETQYNARKLNDVTAELQKAQATITTKETENATLREQFREFRQREREFLDKIETLAARAAAAETELRGVRGQNVPATRPGKGGGEERTPPSH